MNIQKRVYKYNEQKINLYQKISDLAGTSRISGKWVDENTFILKHKNPLVFFSLEGNISEMEERNKLKIIITGGYRYLMLYILPAAVTVYGLLKLSGDSEKGILFTFAGISLAIFIYLIASVVMSNLKKIFKEALNII